MLKYNNHMAYNGHIGSIKYSEDDNCYWGKIQTTEDLILYEGDTLEQLEQNFRKAVDEYKEVKMSVDANFYVLYGIELEGIAIEESDTETVGDKYFAVVDGSICYNFDKCATIGLTIVNDGYNWGSWCTIGFEILDDDPDTFIKNIQEAKEKWNLIKDDLKEALGDKIQESTLDNPCIVYNAYYS